VNHKRAFHTFLISQLCLFGSIILCLMLAPEGVSMNKGISYFSSQGLTLLPYSLGLLGTAWFVYKAGKYFDEQSGIKVGRWPVVIAILLVIVTAFPFAINETLRSLHRVFSASLFLTQLGFVIWMTLKVRRDTINAILIASLVTVIFGTLHYLSPILRILIVGEVSFQLIFAIAVYHSLFEKSSQPALAS
jgi:hypothetical protein